MSDEDRLPLTRDGKHKFGGKSGRSDENDYFLQKMYQWHAPEFSNTFCRMTVIINISIGACKAFKVKNFQALTFF